MLKTFKSKSTKKDNEKPLTGYIGVIDEVSCDRVRGWIASAGKTAINKPVTIKINEKLIEVERVIYRDDLKSHGIAEGKAAFDISFDDDSTSLNIGVFIEGPLS
ncbi:hypothetical protein [Endozoicomonas sp. ISHI1]|uniref:hypothetical protein n=1 Tax=Endozoicomonas sp. ISHI1 TaxID=2825882 RepID=UPI002148A213|nr:hypothetical protein [Endozoicomonas sp. ISHI1]